MKKENQSIIDKQKQGLGLSEQEQTQYVIEVKPLKERGSVKLSDNKNSPNDIGVQMSDKWIKS